MPTPHTSTNGKSAPRRPASTRETAASRTTAAAGSHGKDAVALLKAFAEGGPGQPAGLVHFAAVSRGRPTRHRVERFGDIGRAALRIRALETALALLRDELTGAPRVDAA